eukprot:scpid35462/ scgid29105/ Tyrosine-protein kinase Mer; Proto-oncogene c-Mer; Receptor tyrosine kinase MerTK
MVRGQGLLLMVTTAILGLGLYSAESFVLRVTPAFQAEFLGELQGIPLSQLTFIANNEATPILLTQLTSGLLKFDERYTYVSMQWFRQSKLEEVNYTMTVTSSDTSIMLTPTVTGVPLQGFIQPVFSNLTEFNTSLDCIREGISTLQVVMDYDVFTYGTPNMTTVPDDSGDGLDDNVTMAAGITTQTPTMNTPGVVLLSKKSYTAILRIRKQCAAPTVPPMTLPAEDLSSGAVAGIVIGALVFSIVLMVLVLLLVRHSKLDKKTRRMTQDLVKMNELVDSDMRVRTTTGYSGYNDSTAGLPPMAEEELATLMERLRGEYTHLEDYLVGEDDIVLGKEIGRGAFGRVYDGKVLTVPKKAGKDGEGKKEEAVSKDDGKREERRPLQVAIKTVKTAVRPQDIEEFLAEASLMKGFQHPNVVALVGICLEGSEPPKVCLEYMGMGDLRGYLRKSRGIGDSGEIVESNDEEHSFSVETPQLLIFCLHIAQGMAYLERKKFVHRDLATRNCMLNDQLIVKIGDFGLARDIQEDNYYRMGTARRLPVKWMSLESLQDQIYTTMSDVWSYGIVMWEVFNLGQSPYPGLANDELPTFLLSGKRLGRPSLCPEDLYAMMATCWSKEPSERPSFHELTRLLTDYKDSFYANVPLKMGLEHQEYQNINPKAEVGSALDRTMSVSGYSHAGAGSIATGVTYVQDSEGRLYVCNAGSQQYSAQSVQYSTESQYTGGSADFINPGYHLVNTNVIPEGFVCLPQGVTQQMVVMNPAAYDQLDPYRNVPVGITAIDEQPRSPTSMASSIPPPPPTLDSPMPREINGEYVAHL